MWRPNRNTVSGFFLAGRHMWFLPVSQMNIWNHVLNPISFFLLCTFRLASHFLLVILEVNISLDCLEQEQLLELLLEHLNSMWDLFFSYHLPQTTSNFIVIFIIFRHWSCCNYLVLYFYQFTLPAKYALCQNTWWKDLVVKGYECTWPSFPWFCTFSPRYLSIYILEHCSSNKHCNGICIWAYLLF